jgi:membrane-anchored mycosin MYCP
MARPVMRRACGVLFAAAVLLAGILAGGGTAYAMPPTAPECKPPANHQHITDIPWPVRRYAPARIWPLATGAGQTVAVIDSGVDANHPQLAGKVDAGLDLLDKQPAATFDCIGHGTGVASIIAASVREGVGFTGLAPGARILPIRVSEQPLVDNNQNQGGSVDPGGFAQAILYAVNSGARVINLSVYYFVDDKRVRDAIEAARAKDIVIVAAVGNSHSTEGAQPDPTPYPAAYPGVLGVGAIDESGARASESQVGSYVDLVAPGGNVTMAANRSKDYWVGQGTSFAVPYVAAAAALVLSRWPKMHADEVIRRLEATADPARGGPHSTEYGYGEVDPYRAVTEVHATAKPQRPAPLPVRESDPAAVAAAASKARAERIATAATVGAIFLVVAMLFAAVVLPKGRRRRWRPGTTPPAEHVDPSDDALFSWSLGPPPALAHPDRALDEELARRLSRRS